MKLYELDARDFENARYDPSEDKINTRQMDDTRKEKLTLMSLNKLKRLRALNQLEALKRESLLAAMYGKGDDSAPAF